MATQETLNQVQQLYVAYYGRPADAAGLAFWAGELEANGGDVSVIINDFGNSAEFEARFGEMSNEELVNNLYQQLFGRDADAEGLAFYTNDLDSGNVTLAEIAATIAGGAQDNEDGDNDLTTLNNKVAAANQYTEAAGDQHSGQAADDYAAEWLATIDADTDVDAIEIDDVIADLPEPTDPEEPEEPSIPGETFILTEMPESYKLLEGIETGSVEDYSSFDPSLIISQKLAPVLTTSEKNDGVIGSGLASGADDRIITDAYGLHGAVVDAGGGNNSLRVDMKGPFAQPTLLANIQTVTVTNLQNVYDETRADWMNLDGIGGSANSILDLSRALDIEQLVVNEGSAANGSLDIWNIQNGAEVRLEGNFQQDVRLDYAGSLNAVDVVLSNVRFETGNDFEVSHNAGQVNLTSEGRLNILDNSNFGDFLDTLVIDGDAELEMTQPIDFRTSRPIEVDASATTGGVTLAVNLNGHQTGVVNLEGGSGDDLFGLAGQTEIGADDEPLVTLTADMGAGNNVLLFLESATLTETSTITGENVVVELEENVTLDITETEALFGEGNFQILMGAGSDVVLTQAQYDELGAEAFVPGRGVDDATVSLQVTEDFDVSTLNPEDLADGVSLGLNIAEDVTLTLTGDQLVELLAADVTFSGEGTVMVEGVTQANIDAAAAAGVTSLVLMADGSTAFSFAEDVVVPEGLDLGTNLGATPDNVFHNLNGNNLTLSEPSQANGLEVTNGTLKLDFVGTSGVSMDMRNYTDISNIEVYEALVANNTNIEDLFLNLASSVEEIRNLIDVVETPVDLLDQDRIVNVFEGVTMSGSEIGFVTPTNSENADNVQNVVLNLLGDATVTGSVILDRNTDKNGSLQTLTINSEGDAANTITGGITGNGTNSIPNVTNSDVNNVLNVAINAGADLAIGGTILFTSNTAGATATLSVTGDADVSIKALDTTDGDVDSLVIDTTDYTGTLTITGGSDSLELANTESLVFTGSGDVVLDLSDDDDGIDGAGDLQSINAAAHTGSLTLGVVKGINAEDFTFTAGAGETSLTLTNSAYEGSATDDEPSNWTFNLGENTTLTLDANTITFGNSTAVNGENGDSLTINGGTVIIDGILDLTAFVDDDGVSTLNFDENVVLQLADAASALKMTDAQWEALPQAVRDSLETDNVLEVTQDFVDLLEDGTAVNSADLTELRGYSQIVLTDDTDVLNANVGITMTPEQAAITVTLDEDGERHQDADDVDLPAGDVSQYNAVITVSVTRDADLRALVLDSNDVIQISDESDPKPEVSITEAQLANLEGTAAQLKELFSDLTVSVDVRIGDDAEGEDIVETRDVVFSVDEDGVMTAEAHALALAAAQNGAQSVELNALLDETESTQVNFVGTTPFLEQNEPLDAHGANSAFTFSFVSGTVDNADTQEDFTSIVNFQAGVTGTFDVLDFSAFFEADGFDTVADGSTGEVDPAGEIVLFTGTSTLSADDFSDDDTAAFDVNFDGEAVIVAQNGTTANAYHVTGDGAGSVEIVQIAELTGVAGAFEEGNFGIA